MESKHVDLGGPVHYADFGGSGGPPIVLVHGLGGSHLNWSAVGRALSARARVFAPDLHSFGRTKPDGRSASVDANLDLLDRFLREVVGEPAILIGNSMGGMLSMRQAAKNPDSVVALVLVGPALIRPPRGTFNRRVATMFALQSIPKLGEKLLRDHRLKVGPDGLVDELLALCTVKASRVDAALVAQAKELSRERSAWPGVDERYLEAARSLVRRLFLHADDVKRELKAVRAPTMIVHGTMDRLVPVEATMKVARMRPDWRIEILEDAGHIPQLEAPSRFLARVTPWLDELAISSLAHTSWSAAAEVAFMVRGAPAFRRCAISASTEEHTSRRDKISARPRDRGGGAPVHQRTRTKRYYTLYAIRLRLRINGLQRGLRRCPSNPDCENACLGREPKNPRPKAALRGVRWS